MARVSSPFQTRIRLLACLTLLFASGCSQQQGSDIVSQFREGKPQEFLQTSVDRMATLAMHDNLESLYLLMSKLYLRNPQELKNPASSMPAPPKSKCARPSKCSNRCPPWAARKTWRR